MGTAQIPITRRHYAGQAALEAGIIVDQEWAYDETNERFGVRLSDSTYRFHGRSELFPPGAGVTSAVSVAAGGLVGLGGMVGTELVSINTPTEVWHVIDVVTTGLAGTVIRKLKCKYDSTIGYVNIRNA